MFKDRINHSLSGFVDSWNNHPLTAEYNSTPLQLFKINCNLDSDSSDDIVQPQSQQSSMHLQATSYVNIPNLSFNPCLSLHTQVTVMVLQASTQKSCDVYR